LIIEEQLRDQSGAAELIGEGAVIGNAEGPKISAQDMATRSLVEPALRIRVCDRLEGFAGDSSATNQPDGIPLNSTIGNRVFGRAGIGFIKREGRTSRIFAAMDPNGDAVSWHFIIFLQEPDCISRVFE